MQTRLESLIETCVNTAIGFVISLLGQYLIFPWFIDAPVNHSAHLGIAACFTVVSVARGYAVRRWFNARIKRLAHKLAERV